VFNTMLAFTHKPSLVGMFAAALLAFSAAGPAIAQTTAQPTLSEQNTPGHEHHRGELLAVAAQAIGITPEQLRQELPGKSLAEVAQAHGKNPADVANALKTASDQHIDQLVTHVWPAQGTEQKEEGTGGAAPAGNS
jgi:hypothetical protein